MTNNETYSRMADIAKALDAKYIAYNFKTDEMRFTVNGYTCGLSALSSGFYQLHVSSLDSTKLIALPVHECAVSQLVVMILHHAPELASVSEEVKRMREFAAAFGQANLASTEKQWGQAHSDYALAVNWRDGAYRYTVVCDGSPAYICFDTSRVPTPYELQLQMLIVVQALKFMSSAAQQEYN